MQPDGQSAHICGSKAAGVKTPKHPLHQCLDFSIMRYGDGWSWRESRDGAHRPMGALVRDDCRTTSFLYLLCRATCWCLPSNRQKKERRGRRRDLMALFSKHDFFNPLLSSPPSCQVENIPLFRCFPAQRWWFYLPHKQNLWILKINTASLFRTATNLDL